MKDSTTLILLGAGAVGLYWLWKNGVSGAVQTVTQAPFQAVQGALQGYTQGLGGVYGQVYQATNPTASQNSVDWVNNNIVGFIASAPVNFMKQWLGGIHL